MSLIADIDCPQDWQTAADLVARDPGVALVVGAVDSGKSTLCRFLAHYCATQGRRTAILDADLGQSWIGPPTTIGFALVDDSMLEESTPEPTGMWFVGATSPQGHMLQTAVGVRKMADAARQCRAECIIVDTSGWVDGPAARALKEAKIALLAPRHILGIQYGDEIRHITAACESRADISVHSVRASRRTRSRDADRRRAYREQQFREYFAESAELALPFADITVLGTSLLSGTPAPGHVRAYAEELLGIECFHAEILGEQLLLVCEHLPDPAALRALREQFPEEEPAVFALNSVPGALVGLSDSDERLLGIGTLVEMDFQAKRILVTTPVTAAEDVAAVTVGTMRLQPDFSQLGSMEERWP